MSSSSASLDGESSVRCDCSDDQLRVDDWGFCSGSAVRLEGLRARLWRLIISSCGPEIMGTWGPGAIRLACVSLSGPGAKAGREGERAAGEVLER